MIFFNSNKKATTTVYLDIIFGENNGRSIASIFCEIYRKQKKKNFFICSKELKDENSKNDFLLKCEQLKFDIFNCCKNVELENINEEEIIAVSKKVFKDKYLKKEITVSSSRVKYKRIDKNKVLK